MGVPEPVRRRKRGEPCIASGFLENSVDAALIEASALPGAEHGVFLTGPVSKSLQNVHVPLSNEHVAGFTALAEDSEHGPFF